MEQTSSVSRAANDLPTTSKSVALRPLIWFTVGLLVYTVLVILWGAWVRISGSGDGCGTHWPFCNGQIIPLSGSWELWIEYLHRLSTKLYGFIVIFWCIWVFRAVAQTAPSSSAHSPSHQPSTLARKACLLTLFFTLIEGLIGAVLVLNGYVDRDPSYERALMMSLHLLNTFLLSGSLFWTLVALTGDGKSSESKKIATQSRFKKQMGVLLGIWLLVSFSGAMGALASMLNPNPSDSLWFETLTANLAKDFNSASHISLRVRFLHPLFALLFVAGAWAWSSAVNTSRKARQCFRIMLIANVVVGILTLGLLSPTPFKILHLALTHGLWLAFLGVWILGPSQVKN